MAAESTDAELLAWPQKDKRRFLHAVYHVGDLDRTIKYYMLLYLFIHLFSHICVFYYTTFLVKQVINSIPL